MITRVSRILDGKELSMETGMVAKQANGSVTVRLGGTVVLVTSVVSKEPKEGVDFFPLTVEYQEKTYAAGKIPGGFFKREGRPSEKEILTARLIDRPIRPLFPEGMVNDVQVVALVLSSDGENDSDILAVNGASMALCISDIPFDGPIGCVRIGLVDGKFILNPTFKELEASELDLVAVCYKEKIIMMETGANELPEERIEDAIELAKKHVAQIIDLQNELIRKCGKKKTEDLTILKPRDGVLVKIKALALGQLNEINKMSSKEEREESLGILTKEVVEKLLLEDTSIEEWEINLAIRKVEKETVRKHILESASRVDGRSYEDIRPIECAIGILPRTHGSGLFTRGQTQALCVTTLGTSADEQMIDGLEGEMQKSFMLHYNFPSFSVGEVGPFRGPGRREIGHGALAEKALKPVMPSKEAFPYTVRIVSDILESNGSSSMASVCAGSLSLMDAGVPIKAQVSGIAIGLVREAGKNVLLTDIAGVEDHYGDMDFKIAGTKKGITAIQLDLKIKGIDKEITKTILAMAKKARLTILEKMNDVIVKPKESISSFAPRIINLKVNPEKIKDIIGPGGRTIKKIIRDTGVTIEVNDDGTVQIASTDAEASKKALDIIKGLSAEVEVGQIYTGKITRLLNFGGMCEILPGKEGLVHISEIANRFIKDINEVLKVGDEVKVKVIEIDQQGRINLSMKQVSGGEGYEEDKDQDKKETRGS